MRIVFYGTPDFARGVLDALVASPHDVVAVVTQPDKRQGRKNRLTPPPVKVRALEAGIPVLQPVKAKTRQFRETIESFAPDVAVVAAYGQILTSKLLEAPRLGSYNVHASLLPRHRGAAPIQAAIAEGDDESGVTIMKMDRGLDTGPMALREAIPLTDATTADVLHDDLMALGARLMVEALERLEAGSLPLVPQPDEGATYAPMLSREDGRLDPTLPAAVVGRRMRAHHPWPGTFATVDGATIKLFPPVTVRPGGQGTPGDLSVEDGRLLVVRCADGAVAMEGIQPAGKRRMTVEAFAQGYSLPEGARIS